MNQIELGWYKKPKAETLAKMRRTRNPCVLLAVMCSGTAAGKTKFGGASTN